MMKRYNKPAEMWTVPLTVTKGAKDTWSVVIQATKLCPNQSKRDKRDSTHNKRNQNAFVIFVWGEGSHLQPLFCIPFGKTNKSFGLKLSENNFSSETMSCTAHLLSLVQTEVTV